MIAAHLDYQNAEVISGQFLKRIKGFIFNTPSASTGMLIVLQTLSAQIQIRYSDETTKRLARAHVSKGKIYFDTQAQYIEYLELNNTHAEVMLNFLQHHGFDCDSVETLRCFSWVTDLNQAIATGRLCKLPLI